MNRVEFLQKIYVDNDVGNINIIKDFFEQYMLIYDLTQNFLNKVEIVHLDDRNGQFRLWFNTEDELYNLFCNMPTKQQIKFYSKVFRVEVIRDGDKSVIVSINNIV